MRSLSARERKIVAVGLLVLLVLVVWALVVAPLIDGAMQRSQQRALLMATYERNARLINAIPAQRRKAEQMKPLVQRFAIGGNSAEAARKRLQEQLRAAFTKAGGQITTSQDSPSPDGAVRGWVEGRMTLPALEALLAGISDTPPYLTIESLRVSADSVLETGRLDKLDVRIEASIPYLPAAS